MGGAVWLVPEHTPPRRAYHVMAYDPVRDEIVLFGGTQSGLQCYKILNVTWSWDGQTWEQETEGVAPPPRSGLTMATFGEQVVMFGGVRVNHYYHDTWVLGSDGWQSLESSSSPQMGESPQLEWDPVRTKPCCSVASSGGRTTIAITIKPGRLHLAPDCGASLGVAELWRPVSSSTTAVPFTVPEALCVSEPELLSPS